MSICVRVQGARHVYLMPARARCVCIWPLLWRKLVGPSALQSHLEFICKPDPDSCLFFLSGEGKRNGGAAKGEGVGVWLMSEKVIDIGEDRVRMEVRL